MEANPHVIPQVEELIIVLDNEMGSLEVQQKLDLFDREHLRLSYLNPELELGLIEMTIPDKPNSSLQKYRLTQLGIALKKKL